MKSMGVARESAREHQLQLREKWTAKPSFNEGTPAYLTVGGTVEFAVV